MTTTDNEVLYIGWATEDITPEGPVSLYGQYYERMSKYVQSPLTVTACALEGTGAQGQKEQAIMVSMDVIHTIKALQDALRDRVAPLLPDFDVQKLFLNATHTHSAPFPDGEGAFGELMLERLTRAVVKAWTDRQPAGISTVLGHAVVGHNRRVLYADGTAEMYGATDRSDFIGIEGPADPGVNMVFCWDEARALTGIIMNVACPAQVTEAKYFVSADYWGEVRSQLKEKYGKAIYVLAQCGPAGDLSPRDLPRGYRAGEPNMWDVAGMVEIGKRLVRTVDQAYEEALRSVQTRVVLKHAHKELALPTRRVGKAEYEKALLMVQDIRSREPEDPNSPETAWNRFLQEIAENETLKEVGPWDSKTSDFGWLKPQELVLQQYEEQDKNPFYHMELHVLRLGDVVFATNPFELFVDYGFMITGRSKAKQTFLVQLSCDSGGYLPTARALQGGGYSAMANPIGPEGGYALVTETLGLINSMWEKVKPLTREIV